MMSYIINQKAFEAIHELDKQLSDRFIDLDPSGYFLIKLDWQLSEIVLEHFSNDINESGQAIDPDTGQPISCNDNNQRKPIAIYKGRSAKEIGIKITEGKNQYPLSRLDHALYLGRELQKAELCLITGKSYIQD